MLSLEGECLIVEKEKTVRTTIIMPEDLYTRFANLAKKERRTVNAQLTVAVEKVLLEAEEAHRVAQHQNLFGNERA